MKFGRRLQEEAFEEFQPHYIAYKELKKAIKLITGSDTSQFTISEVTSNFGNIPALAGSTYRPPESRFQDLLDFEVEKINKFSALIYSSISSNLQAALKIMYHGDVATLGALNGLREGVETASDGVAHLHSYTQLNFLGFRKITKKYDKHNKSAASGFYLARLVKEPFANLNFDFLVELISVVFGEMRRLKRVLLSRLKKRGTPTIYPGSDGSDEDSIGYDENDLDLDDETDETYDYDVRNNGQVVASCDASADMTNTTYLVGEADLMRVRVHLSKHIPLTSLGSITCPKTSREIVKAFVSGIPEHHQQGSTFVSIEAPTGPSEPLPRCARQNTNVILDASGHFVNPAIYRFEQNRASSGCLYFDNEGLEIYRELLSPQVNESKAQILRLRWVPDWYRSKSEGSSDRVIVETVKAFQPAESPNEWHDLPMADRNEGLPNAVVLSRSDIPSLLSGTLSVESILENCVTSPNRTSQIRAVLEYALSIILQRQCKPVFQEWMHRSHFRKHGPNVTRAVYAQLDESIRFTNPLETLERDPSFASFWTAPHLSPFIMDRRVHYCPYGVLTVSLAGSAKPKFLPKISGLITVSEVWRYAPQLHGVSLLKRAELGSSDLPHWFQFISRDSEDSKTQVIPKETKHTKGDRTSSTDGNNVVRVDVVSTKPGSRMLHEHVVTLQQQQGAVAEDRQLSATVTRQSSITPGRSHQGLSSLHEPLLSSVHVPISEDDVENNSLYHGVGALRVDSTARTPMIASPDQISVGHQENLVARFSRAIHSLIPSSPSWLTLSGDSSRHALVGAASVRVEPKTFFANERTLLQWMNTAVLLSTISITLLNFGTPTGRLAGLIMAPVALFFIVYSFLVYLRRSYSLEKKEPINYNDRLGPAILVCCLICALSAIIILNIIYVPADDYGASVTNSTPEVIKTGVSRVSSSVSDNQIAQHSVSSDFLSADYHAIGQ